MQVSTAVGFVVMLVALTRSLGTAIVVGGNVGTVGDYYDFPCPKSCSIINRTTDFECRLPMESVGIFWFLVLAFGAHLFGSAAFARFIHRVIGVHSGRIRVKGSGVVPGDGCTLLQFAKGDYQNTQYNSFLDRYVLWVLDQAESAAAQPPASVDGVGIGDVPTDLTTLPRTTDPTAIVSPAVSHPTSRSRASVQPV